MGIRVAALAYTPGPEGTTPPGSPGPYGEVRPAGPAARSAEATDSA